MKEVIVIFIMGIFIDDGAVFSDEMSLEYDVELESWLGGSMSKPIVDLSPHSYEELVVMFKASLRDAIEHHASLAVELDHIYAQEEGKPAFLRE